jgi:transposase-like protein
MSRRNEISMQRDAILDLAFSGHSPKALASQFGMTEWAIRRWIAQARRREQLPYWKQMNNNGAGSHDERG